MFGSNYLSKITFATVLVATIFSVSCLRSSRDSKAPQDENSANDFKVVELTGSAKSKNENSVWRVPTKKTYEFTVCLLSRSSNTALPSRQPFRITSRTQKTVIKEETDNRGCLVWTEDVPYNYSANPIYVERIRKLTGTGNYNGQYLLRFAVNPWLDDKDVVDLNRNSVPDHLLAKEELEALALSGSSNENKVKDILLDSSPFLKVIPTKDTAYGKEMSFVLKMNPYISTVNMLGDEERKILRSGKFRVYAQLVGSYLGEGAKKHAILTPAVQAKEVTIKNGRLSLTIEKIPLNRRIDMGRVQLALKLVPVENPFPMKPYEGLHSVGSFDELYSGGAKVQIKGSSMNSAFDYSNFISTAEDFDKLKEANAMSDLPPFFYSELEPRFVRIKTGETSIRRTVIFRLKTKVTDSVTGKTIINTPFIIKLANGKEEEALTNSSGDLRWFDEVSHMYYQPEQYFAPKYEIVHKNSKRSDKFAIAINPWDTGWTFGTDIKDKKIAKKYKEMDNQEVRRSLFMIDAFRYQTIRFRYVIDKFMNLHVKKAVVMAFDPLVQRYTIERGRSFEVLRDGIYLLKIALVKNYIDPFKNSTRLVRDNKRHYLLSTAQDVKAEKGIYTTVIKKLVRIQAGRLTTPVEFSMRDLRMMSIRNNLMVQIETIDEDRLMQDNIVDAKLRKLVEEYKSFHSKHMTDDEKEVFFKEKEELFIAEKRRFRKSIEKDLAELKGQREYFSDLQSKRFEALTALEDNINSDAESVKTSQIYKQNLNLPEDEFNQLIKDTRSKMMTMHEQIDSYWGDWGTSWRERELEIDKKFYEMNQPSPLKPSESKLVSGASKRAEEVVSFLAGRPKSNSAAAKSYLDYLSVIQHFMKKFTTGTALSNEDLRKMKLNNYTSNPAAPFVDLNLYSTDRKENGAIDSGLSKRTFIAPCTLVENDNMSDMRPTDTIEKLCGIDCRDEVYPRDEADNSEFENSAYHDSIKPFSDLHVDDTIELHKENELRYDRTMKAISQVGNFTKSFNLEYVSLAGKPQKIYKNGCDFSKEDDCFENRVSGVTSTDTFMEDLNSGEHSDLLSHFFYATSNINMYSAEEKVIRTESLQPLWPKAKDKFFKRLETISDYFKTPYSPVSLSDFNMERLNQEAELEKLPPSVPGGYRYAEADLNTSAAINFYEKELGSRASVVNSNKMARWLHRGKEAVDIMDALRICDRLANQSAELLDAKNLSRNVSKTALNIRERCLSRVRYLPKRKQVYFDGMSFDQRYKIIKTGGYKHVAGKNMNINVGADFSITGFSDVSESYTLGANAAGLIGLSAAGIGLASKMAGPAAILSGLGALLIADTTTSETSGQNLANSTSVSIATFLVVQKAEMDIEILKHEKCLDIQLSPRIFKGIEAKELSLKKGVNMSDKDIQESLFRGFMLCEGKVTDKPEIVRENYYYVTQHFTAGDMLDAANLLNHVWLLALRGDKDYETFIEVIKGRKMNDKGEIIEEDKVNSYPLTRLHDVYNQVHPSFPGMYSVQKP